MPGVQRSHADWTQALTNVCQVFVGEVLDADRDAFENAIDWLASSVPYAVTRQQSLELLFRLKDSALRGAAHFHRRYHATVAQGPCASIAIELQDQSWALGTADPRDLLRSWKHQFLSAFDDTHPQPAADRLAALIRRCTPGAFCLDGACRSLGVSRSAMCRAFRLRYGTSIMGYRRCCVLRWVVIELRRPGSHVEAVALGAGYSSKSSCYDALWKLARITPGEVRSLGDEACRLLLDGPVRLPVPEIGGTSKDLRY